MLLGGWRDQWDRVGRFLERVRVVYAGRSEGGTVDALDDVYGFFQSIHHLKDWLGNDPTVTVTKDEGDRLIDSRTVLQVCADVANGSKHLTLDRRSRTGDPSTGIARSDVVVPLDVGAVQHRFHVQSGAVEHGVLDLAERAVNEWRAFLEAKGLLP